MAFYALLAIGGLSAFHTVYGSNMRPVLDSAPLGQIGSTMPVAQANMRDLRSGEPPEYDPLDGIPLDTTYTQAPVGGDLNYDTTDAEGIRIFDDGGIQRARAHSLSVHQLDPTKYVNHLNTAPGIFTGDYLWADSYQ
jgi:hypothetical protein